MKILDGHGGCLATWLLAEVVVSSKLISNKKILVEVIVSSSIDISNDCLLAEELCLLFFY